MSIPLERLYHYIESVTKKVHKDNIIIYRFYPHGSKKPNDLLTTVAFTWFDHTTNLQMFCNDQEPLHWELYADNSNPNNDWDKMLVKNSFQPIGNNFCKFLNIYDKQILLHSEQRSSQCEIYQKNNFVLAYYWSHALISRDWFRFAKHVNQKKSVKKLFLIYNRAWIGTREYRLKFLELLVNANLIDSCQTTIAPIDSESNLHYQKYKFQNPVWRPKLKLEDYYPINNVPSHYSADFELSDYENSEIEIVLETLFDDDRLHLTEKSLRPIACGQPFILAATHGSLEYLRRYGFKTYADIWDEDYDSIVDATERLKKITELMTVITQWDSKTRNKKLKQAQKIARYNKKHFFSQKFFKLITDELDQNLRQAVHQAITSSTGKNWLELRRRLATVEEIKNIITAKVPHPNAKNLPYFYSTLTRENIVKTFFKVKELENLKHQKD